MAYDVIRVQIDGLSPDLANTRRDSGRNQINSLQLGAAAGLASRGAGLTNKLLGGFSDNELGSYVNTLSISGRAPRQKTRRGRVLARRVEYRDLLSQGTKNIKQSASNIARNLNLPTTKQINAGVTAISGISTFALSHLEQNAAMRGANHKADQYSSIKNAVGAAAGISTAFLIGGPVGGAVALSGLAYKEAMDAKRELREYKVSTIERQDTLRRLNRTVTEGRF